MVADVRLRVAIDATRQRIEAQQRLVDRVYGTPQHEMAVQILLLLQDSLFELVEAHRILDRLDVATR